MMCLVLSVMAFAQTGVDFQHLTFDEALAKAKAEKKLVFVDCYTTWCGPCKMMTTKIFPMKEAGEFFNPRFVCVKFDMEQGEGKELKNKLGVRAYPSFFIIRPDGTVQHAVVGGGELEPFIERVKKGLNEKTSLLYLNQQYEKGKMNKKQLLAYKVALDDAYDQKKAEQVKKELLSQVTEKDKLKKEFWPLFEDGTCTVGTPDFNLILANIPTFEKNIGKEKLDEFLFSAYSRALSPHLYGNKERQTVSLDELKQQIGKLDLQKKNDLLSLCDIAGLVAQGDVNQLVSKVEENAATLTGNDLSSMLMAFGAMRDKATKADYNRMVAAAEKMMANPANSEMKNYLEYYVESWKNLAHVGVNFQDLTFEQAVEKAAKMRKQIFVDCYTSWCGPCKNMTQNVFPQKKAGDYFNPKFICVKYDMETRDKELLKGDEFAITLGNMTYTERSDGGTAMLEMLSKCKSGETYGLGSFRGFELFIEKNYMGVNYMILRGKTEYKAEMSTSPVGNMIKLDNLFNSLSENEEFLNKKIEQYKRDLESSKEEYEKPFAYEKELKDKLNRQSELNAVLDLEKSIDAKIICQPENEKSGKVAEDIPEYTKDENRGRI